jgi:zinc transport system substrate-binding protein
LGIFSVTLLGFTPHVSAELKVVTSIKPIHSLVSAVMDGAGSSELLIEGASSPHSYAMRPSQARSLQDADVVFWVGPELDAFLVKPISTTAINATSVSLMESDGVVKRAFREEHGGHDHDHGKHEEENHDHAKHDEHKHDEHKDEHAKHDEQAGHDHGAHGEDATDPHIWLDPENAKAMTRTISDILSAADPANAALYSKNADVLIVRLDELSAEIQTTVKPIQGKAYVVFHDAYQYFEERYGLESAGSVTVNPEVLPGAEHLREIKEKVATLGATCVFAEPQFKPKLVEVVIEGTPAKSGVLDPLGAGIAKGPDQYFDLMKAMATSMRDCLS